MKQISEVEENPFTTYLNIYPEAEFLDVFWCEIFNCSDFIIFTPSSLWVGDFGVKI
jgi:hypothetical protein